MSEAAFAHEVMKAFRAAGATDEVTYDAEEFAIVRGNSTAFLATRTSAPHFVSGGGESALRAGLRLARGYEHLLPPTCSKSGASRSSTR
jgi:hypothetical protein